MGRNSGDREQRICRMITMPKTYGTLWYRKEFSTQLLETNAFFFTPFNNVHKDSTKDYTDFFFIQLIQLKSSLLTIIFQPQLAKGPRVMEEKRHSESSPG